MTLLFLLTLLSQTAPQGWTVVRQGSTQVFHPTGLRSGEDLRVDVDDPVPASGDFGAWMRQRLVADSRLSSEAKSRCRFSPTAKLELSCNGTTADGAFWLYGWQLANGAFRTATVIARPNLMTAVRYGNPVQSVLDGAQAASALASTPTPAPVPVPVVAEDSSFRMPIEALYLHLEYRVGVGGGIYPNYIPYVLLKDGTITNDLDYYPRSSADVAAWRRRDPRNWGRWTRQGSTIRIQWDDPKQKPETWDKWIVPRPGNAGGHTLTGRYRSIGGGGNTALGGDAMVVVWSNYEFHPDGSVTTEGGAGSSTGGAGTGVGVTASGKRPVQMGRYSIDGYSIGLQFGGQHRRHWFYLYPEGDGALGIGERVYSNRK